MKKYSLLFALVILVSCKSEKEEPQKTLQIGTYKALLKVNDSIDMPFVFMVLSENKLQIFNSEEVIDVDEITYRNDSVFIKPPVFDSYIAAKITDAGLEGNYIKDDLNRNVPFTAVFGKTKRFEVENNAETDVSGNWETIFSPDSEADKYIAKGIFKQDKNKVTGTFRTTTGDYRFLEGVLDGNQLKLSTFDGAHAYLFHATVTDSIMQGMFYSGNHYKEPFTAKRNEAFELPDANNLTFLKEGYDKVAFSFPDENGKMVSLEDDRFKDKVVLVQIMGTWCPNCLDESKYLANYYKNNKNNKNNGLEIIGLAFEYTKTEEKAIANIKRLKNRLEIDYPILLAQYGSSSKVSAQEKLPMLNQVLSYPTTIFIDKTGNVRKIHTGFNGPATGEKYLEFTNEFESFVKELKEE
ncbi:TlpA disulfide reductase family protein [Xanthomarina sp. F2636L]|uniref:TlpA disulfide reductase family protein n=1 Tax=Xanthomarina sp. F2636L TaxID=2996018 RepID=UPI00225E02DC|nr:TlpA disulfide reductase family protein [Xanthomarina sp. F2636L]MCX7552145.1 TlpA disulfide reductase family protein [Xanthomarina sp. F2636L]